MHFRSFQARCVSVNWRRKVALASFVIALALTVARLGNAQSVEIRDAERLVMPGPVDSNSPALWHEGRFYLFNSANVPFLAVGEDAQDVFTQPSQEVFVGGIRRRPLWFEAAWRRADGSIYAWYHHEAAGACPDSDLTVPVIGAAVSRDGGASFEDLGIVLAPDHGANCEAQNGYFAGGHGDFTVIPDRDGRYFYFYFGNYGGPAEQQGVGVARMAVEDLDNPAGKVMKYFAGRWEEPGIGGRVSPVLPALVPWQEPDTDAFWGPAIHWNTYLELYVMLLNRACCSPGWPQEGIYISLNSDLSDPTGWTEPAPLLRSAELGVELGWYPQILGFEPGETDSIAGKKVRLFTHGVSYWEIEFHRPD